jgi:hypothetical protein
MDCADPTGCAEELASELDWLDWTDEENDNNNEDEDDGLEESGSEHEGQRGREVHQSQGW